jgi:hypothetical protein
MKGCAFVGEKVQAHLGFRGTFNPGHGGMWPDCANSGHCLALLQMSEIDPKPSFPLLVGVRLLVQNRFTSKGVLVGLRADL